MGAIVAIGGGTPEAPERAPIDRRILELTGRERPKALFVPTASYDSPERWEAFRSVYEGRLGCETRALWLLGRRPPPGEIEEAVEWADAVYVGGGNTLKMMRRWRLLGVDAALRRAHAAGAVLAGQSAGMLCWFAYGHSDSMFYYSPERWDYVRVRGMGLIDALACPHFDGETDGAPRAASFARMAARYKGAAIGVDNDCAVEFRGGAYRVLSVRAGAWAYRLRKAPGGGMEARPLAEGAGSLGEVVAG